eukprot:5038911-Pleurochrysis_carterae.AAC.2
MAMSDSKYAVAKTFKNNGRAEFLKFKGNLKDILHFHKHKLHTILFDDKLHPAVRRQHTKELTVDKVAAAEMDARMKEIIEACNEDAFAILMINIANTILARAGSAATTTTMRTALGRTSSTCTRLYKDNDTRITKASNKRKALVEEGMASSTEAAARTMVEKLLELNSELHGSDTIGATTCCPPPCWTPWPRTCPMLFACTRPARSIRAPGETILTRFALRSSPCSKIMTGWRARTPSMPNAGPCPPKPSPLEIMLPLCATNCGRGASRLRP